MDRFEARRMLAPCSFVMAAAMAAIALGHVYIGVVVLMVARAIFAIVGPIVAAQRSDDRIGAIAAYATWSDVGLAAGAFVGILAFEWAGYPLTYATLAAFTAASVAWFALRAGAPPPPARA